MSNMQTFLLSENGKWLASLYTFEEDRLAITAASNTYTKLITLVFHSFHVIHVFFPLNTKHSYQGYVICDTNSHPMCEQI